MNCSNKFINGGDEVFIQFLRNQAWLHHIWGTIYNKLPLIHLLGHSLTNALPICPLFTATLDATIVSFCANWKYTQYNKNCHLCLKVGGAASKGKGFLLYNILCVFIYRSSLDQLSLFTHIHAQEHQLSHSNSVLFGICWGNTPQFVGVRQVSAGLVVWVVINCRPYREQTENELTGFCFLPVFFNILFLCMFLRAIFCRNARY